MSRIWLGFVYCILLQPFLPQGWPCFQVGYNPGQWTSDKHHFHWYQIQRPVRTYCYSTHSTEMLDDSSRNRWESWISFDMFQVRRKTQQKAQRHWNENEHSHMLRFSPVTTNNVNFTFLLTIFPMIKLHYNYTQTSCDAIHVDRRLQYPRFKWLSPNSTAFTAVLSENPPWKKHEKTNKSHQ